MSEKIVQLPGTTPLPENPIQIAERSYNLCRHDLITLDEHDRSVRCSTCGQVFDPFSFLKGNAALIQQAWSRHKEVMRKVEEKHASLESLTKEERRLKERVKRLKEKAEPGIDIRGRYL